MAPPNAAPRVQLQPTRFHHTLLDGNWWPHSADLGTELRALVPVLDHARGPVKRLLLSPAGWTTRPSQVIADGHTVSVGYQSGQSPSILTVLCGDGSMVTMRVGEPGPISDEPDGDAS